MAKRYVFVRMPEEIYQKYNGVKLKMESDIRDFSGCDVKLTWPKFFNTLINPKFNENYIQVDLKKLSDLAKKKKGRYE
jgi:hypothetical protein